jgi:WD40 repeat protein
MSVGRWLFVLVTVLFIPTLVRAEPLPEGALRRLGPVRGQAVLACAVSPDGKTVATAGLDETIHLWDRTTGEEKRRLAEKPNSIHSLAFSPDGRTLAAARGDGVISLWNLADGKRIREFRGHTDPLRTVAFSPDGKRLASGGVDESVRIWDTGSGEELLRLALPNCWIDAIAFSPDGQTLATANPYEAIRLWDLKTGRDLRRLGQAKDGYLCLAFSPDGHTVAAAGKATPVRLLEVETGEVRARMEGHFNCVTSMAFLPDGRTLVSASADRTIRAWDLPATKEIHRWEGHNDAVLGLALSRDGNVLVSGGKDGTTLVWDMHERAAVHLSTKERSNADIDAFWEDLGGSDPISAYRAVWRLTESPEETVRFMTKALGQPIKLAPGTVATLITALDDDEFEVRDRASKELAQMGREAEPLLRATLERDVSPEVQRRIEALLAKLRLGDGQACRLRWLRALEVLEQIGTPEARRVVESLAEGTNEAPCVTVEARSALSRMRRP